MGGKKAEIVLSWKQWETIRAKFIVDCLREKIDELEQLLEYHEILANIPREQAERVGEIIDSWHNQFDSYGGDTGRDEPLIKMGG